MPEESGSMPEAAVGPPRDLPLAGRRLITPDNRLTIVPAPAASRYVLRCRPADALLVGNALGIGLPIQACRSHMSGSKAALWLGPDEWLLIADPAHAWARVEGVVISLVDVSHKSVAIELKGMGPEDVLTSDCPLDLHEAKFPPGACTRTVFGKCEVVLWRRAPDAFWLDVPRSHADYAWRLLEAACSDAADLWKTPNRAP
jgi:sarcosine oxidase, subunit gamma